MIRAIEKIIVLALVLSTANFASAMRYMGGTGGNPGMAAAGGQEPSDATRSASCAQATGLSNLEWNNVRARIETGGSMWQDRANNRAAYEVPKGGGVSSIFSGALWLGGLSPDQQLKIAAVTFRASGNDFWPGPLTNDGTAEVTAATCNDYDRFFMSLRQDSQRHRQYWDMIASGATQEQIDDAFPDGYSMPSYFNDYPAHGNTAAGQDYFLAPYYDSPNGQFGVYDPENGDYPYYDFLREIDCAQRKREDIVPLFGDQTYYWIFNDKGNVHTESQGQPIGMEIRAQAFAFTTNDEVNNMTFLNYVLINQGTQTLTNTYFGSWVDCDLGNSTDDYVGCDVQRGLGYCYNGDADDEPVSSSLGYGANPPAVGVDFFEGPYQDADGMANPLTSNIIDAQDSLGIPYKGLGIGYGDTIVDNERFGMRRFVYYNIGTNPINGDPSQPPHYYNYMRGIWKNGQNMFYGGNGVSGNGVINGQETQYMFPGDTDPFNWGTNGIPQAPWSEESSGNPKGDRRFIQSAGPFTLLPGDYNNITVGVVWARANSGDPYDSVRLLKRADDKAQSLFDNCFEIVSGPDAPDVTVQELQNEIILMLSNENSISNNFQETYLEFDPSIPETNSSGEPQNQTQRSYTFEGYLVYQLASAEVSSNDLEDVTKARLVAQCDVENGVSNIINYTRDPDTDLITPELKVQGADNGLRRSFRITEDQFALGSNRLINHKTYYFMVIAYGYNNYEDFNVANNTGQSTSFLSSRKAAVGEIPVIRAIPHSISPEAGGTIAQSNYGDGIPITRLEGQGNALNNLVISPKTEAEILQSPFTTDQLTYLPGNGPVEVKVVDPLRVPAADFELRLIDTLGVYNSDSMYWQLTNLETDEVYTTYRSFTTASEDVIIDYGISINWGQYEYLNSDGNEARHFTDLIGGTIEFKDSSRPWLIGIPDTDGFTELNWIRSGTVESTENTPEAESIYDDYKDGVTGDPFTDKSEIYEGVLSGTVAPFCLVSASVTLADGSWANSAAPTNSSIRGDLSPISPQNISSIKGLNNVDIILTPDKSKWTRCAVLEMQPNSSLAQNAVTNPNMTPTKLKLRRHLSVDKNGLVAGQEGYNSAEGDLTGPVGMGWFPGYAIDLGTGERLNLAFGEDSWLAGENGRDMIWNPTSRLFSNSTGEALFGGQHWVYVFKNLRSEVNDANYNGVYDNGQYIYEQLSNPGLTANNWRRVFRACTWVGSALLNDQYSLLDVKDGLIPNEARISLRVAKPYAKYAYNGANTTQPGGDNDWRNLYTFTTKGIAATTGNTQVLVDVLHNINIVPNPYYAFSTYEANKLDNRVKITNLPEVCAIKIYDMNGTLIREFKKSDPLTSLDWDLKNHKNIPIASGTYIIHIDIPNVGEKILKWFGVMRPIDLDNF